VAGVEYSVVSVPESVPVAQRRHAKYERLIARAKEVPAAATLVVHPCDETSLRGVAEATQAGLIAPTLIGPSAKIAGGKMAERGQITGGLLGRPLAFDNAIDPTAARIIGIKSEVAGRTRIPVVSDLEVGNMLVKNLTFLAQADAAGIVLGARVPIILTSRAGSVRTRCAIAVLYAHARRRTAALQAT
jgi:phosphotransacetylase